MSKICEIIFFCDIGLGVKHPHALLVVIVADVGALNNARLIKKTPIYRDWRMKFTRMGVCVFQKWLRESEMVTKWLCQCRLEKDVRSDVFNVISFNNPIYGNAYFLKYDNFEMIEEL